MTEDIQKICLAISLTRKKSQNTIKLFDKPHFKSFPLNLRSAGKTLRIIFTLDVVLETTLSNGITVEDFLSTQIAIV